jgi:hypothetical protein
MRFTRRALSTVLLIAGIAGLSGCAVYEEGPYYARPHPVRPVYVYPHAYYYGPVHNHWGHRGW